jgi:hypothetical protein
VVNVVVSDDDEAYLLGGAAEDAPNEVHDWGGASGKPGVYECERPFGDDQNVGGPNGELMDVRCYFQSAHWWFSCPV